MAFGDKSAKFVAEREKMRQEQQLETIKREATEVSPDDLNAQDEAEDAARAAAEAEAAAVMTMPVIDPTKPMTMEDIMRVQVQMQAQMMQFMQMMAMKSSPEQIAAIVAEATRKGMEAGADRIKPKELNQNETERRSAFNPDGEKANPRPKLKCHMYFGAAPIGSPKETTTLTHAEIAALNAMTPGHYRIEKMDGTRMVIEVRGQLNSNRQLDRMWIILPEGDDQKNLYPPLASFASQCREDNRVTPEMVA